MRVEMRLRTIFLTAGVALAAVSPGLAQLAGPVPDQLKDVGVEEHLDEALPLDLEFRDEHGKTVALRDFFDGERPVILTLNYYKCPMLCGLQLNGLVTGLADLAWTPGDQFDIVTVSINPLETPELAADKKQNYLKKLGRPDAAQGWHFLTGDEGPIRQLAEAAGFGFRYDPATGDYAHAAALMVVTPKGHLARYLYGIEYPAKKLKLALLEAAEGTIGSPWDQLVMYCYHYDPSNRRYSPVAMNIMRVGGGATVLALGLVIGVLWIRDSRRHKTKGNHTA